MTVLVELQHAAVFRRWSPLPSTPILNIAVNRINRQDTANDLFDCSKQTKIYSMLKFTVLLVSSTFALNAQQEAAITDWHVSRVAAFTVIGARGPSTQVFGAFIANVPNGYKAVVEHVSARCVASPVVKIALAEVVTAADFRNPGEPAAPSQLSETSQAYHPLLFQTAYSGSTSIYVASQQLTLRITSPANGDQNRVAVNMLFAKDTDETVPVDCLISLSGFMQKQ
jgi:hypothetical protein